MDGDLAGEPVGPVVADQGGDIARFESELEHAQGEIAHARLVVAPGHDTPQAEILLAQRDLVAMLAGVEAKQLGKGIRLGCAGGVVDHAGIPAWSSSPR